MQNKRFIALIPAYEPADTLSELTEKLQGTGFFTVVVDDGSGDAFRPVFEKTSAFVAAVLVHEVNQGKGAALKTGLVYIRDRFPEDSVIVTLDADGQHSVEDAVRVAEAAAEDGGTLVLGCRSFREGVPVRSLFGNTTTKLVYRLFTGVRVSDTQTGLRAFSSDLLPFMLSISGDRYEYEMNVLLECSRSRIPIKEIRIQTIYIDNNAGSHFNTIRDSFRVYREIIRFTASSFSCFLLDYGLYSLLALLTAGMAASVSVPLSNITARVVSSIVNYSLNKTFVFRHKGGAVKSAAQYFTLVVVILAANTVLLSFLTDSAGINKFAAKLITELVFFTLSWIVQRFLIFRKRSPGKEKAL
jgi:glycosyltransferase involved in cell wall biosynthesis